MPNSPKQPAAGFTIIELLIVLAVAGVIFIIIFNAVPALLRNSRNNQRKQDVAAILNAVSHYQLSHSGNFPPDFTAINSGKPVRLAYYDSASITISGMPSATSSVPISSVPTDSVEVDNYHLCNPNNPGATNVGAGFRDIVALYNIETTGGTSLKCQQL